MCIFNGLGRTVCRGGGAILYIETRKIHLQLRFQHGIVDHVCVIKPKTTNTLDVFCCNFSGNCVPITIKIKHGLTKLLKNKRIQFFGLARSLACMIESGIDTHTCSEWCAISLVYKNKVDRDKSVSLLKHFCDIWRVIWLLIDWIFSLVSFSFTGHSYWLATSLEPTNLTAIWDWMTQQCDWMTHCPLTAWLVVRTINKNYHNSIIFGWNRSYEV